MVKITNGVDIFEVTQGAFDGIYSKQGYTKFNEELKAKKEEIEEVTAEKSEDEIFCDELLEKPLASWNKDEVKKFAEIKGVDIAGTKNANEAKDRIKAFLDAE